MEIYLDSADVSEVQEAVRLGLISGIRLDPSLASHRKGSKYRETVQEVCHIARVPIHVWSTHTDGQEIIAEATQIAQWSPHVVINIPITAEGLSAIHVLRHLEPNPDEMCVGCAWARECPLDKKAAKSLLIFQGVRTSATLVCSLHQALLASRSGADFISIPLNELDDTEHDGSAVVAGAVELMKKYDLETRVIAANVRSLSHLQQAMQVGAHIAAVPYTVLMESLRHPLTNRLLTEFRGDH